MVSSVFLIIVFLALLVAAYRDIKTREVPDTVSIGLIIVGVLGGLCVAIITRDVSVFLAHLYGFAIGALLGTVMYYGRQWGGGDAKLIMGVGAMLGFSIRQPTLIAFMVMLIICGAAYGIIMTLWLALITHRKKFLPAFNTVLRSKTVHRVRIMLVLSGIACIIAAFFVTFELKIVIGFAMLCTYLLAYLWIFSRAVEQGVMIKQYPVSKLTEGDWIAQDVKVGAKIIVSKDTPGITLEQIAMLRKKKVRTVMVKEGIAFVPAFLLAFILLLALQAWLGEAWFLAMLP